ncbi:MAG: hypothetical protein IVW53_15290 [Chloroflexi bacterium]|nr:hypothetical protein [Chloroflexota bacterium]
MMTKFGYDLATWEKAKAEVVGILGERARSGAGPMTYGDLARHIKTLEVEPHAFAMFSLLGEVSAEEDAIGRGMLSAYVVSSESGPPRAGFFELATRLGRTYDDRRAFWVAEMQRVDAAWRTPAEHR